MRVLIVDNYDSFTYNLYHYLVNEGAETLVVRNDKLVHEAAVAADAIVLSPGPGLPSETEGMYALIEQFHKEKPMLGVCLGMQGIAEFFGGRLVNQEQVKHGFPEQVNVLSTEGVFRNVPSSVQVGLYHSWMVDESSLPKELIVTAKSASGVVMGIQHQNYPVSGVQFHPESVMTEYGREMIGNFLEQV